ncbi:MAG: EF-P lysine aminoacylase GenX [Proteobacteria bacterium]|nr:EF-P lysine aminoacylase GenX [Pseudomonadota bacterium]
MAAKGPVKSVSGKDLQKILRGRMAMEEAVRTYFAGEGFLEATTPVAVPHPNLDPNVCPVPVTVRDFSGFPSRLWLHTSPELSMKKLLARGSGSIFQLGPVFRDGEKTPRHRQEFSMLEWYRAGADYRDAMKDTIAVIRAAARAVRGEEQALFSGKAYDLAGRWEEITMADAFRRYAGVGSWETRELREALRESVPDPDPGMTLEDLFFHLYVGKVEPELGREGPVIVKDFPSFLGTMARPLAKDPAVLERFEVYVAGLELANGYTEFSDRAEIRGRMAAALGGLEKEGVAGLTLDEDFLDALSGMPPCAGVSVGMDRLAMLLFDARDIAQVVFPFVEETV